MVKKYHTLIKKSIVNSGIIFCIIEIYLIFLDVINNKFLKGDFMPYEEHPLFTDPDETNVKLWRYMDFAKLESILKEKALFFSSIKELKKIDTWEGSYPKKELKEMLDQNVQRMKESSCSRIIFDTIKEHSESLQNKFKFLTEYIFVSCWHSNVYESSAMWGLYTKGSNGITIQTNINSLKDSFRNVKQDVHIGKINYKNYEFDEFYDDFNQNDKIKYREHLYTTFIHKRINYDFEREYRAVIDIGLRKGNKDTTGIKIQPEGIFVPVDLKLLIKKIILAPGSPEWFKELVEDTLKTYKLDVEVVRSVVDDEPYKFDLEPYKDLKE